MDWQRSSFVKEPTHSEAISEFNLEDAWREQGFISAHMVSKPLLGKQGSISNDVKSNIYGFHGYCLSSF